MNRSYGRALNVKKKKAAKKAAKKVAKKQRKAAKKEAKRAKKKPDLMMQPSEQAPMPDGPAVEAKAE